MIDFKKAIVIGPCGAGKSTFSRRLRDITNYPLYYLDILYWKENWVGTPRDEFIQIQNNIMLNNNTWIIDGTYHTTLENRIRQCDIIFFLDFDVEICVKQEKQRRGKKREDLPSYLDEDIENDDLEQYIKDFPNNGRKVIVSLLEQYNDKKIIIFHDHNDLDNYLNNIK